MSAVSARRSRALRLTILLVAVLAVPAGALVWLGVRLARQDRELTRGQVIEHQQTALRAVAQGLALSVAHAEQDATDGLASGVVRFTRTSDGILAQPPSAVLWLPRQVSLSPVIHAGLHEAERLEHAGDVMAATDHFGVLAYSPSGPVRANALLGLARLQRRSNDWTAVLSTYERLATLAEVEIAGAPAELQARRATLSVLEHLGRRDALRQGALELEAHLLAGRWSLDRPGWDLVAGDLLRWTGRPTPVDPVRAAFSAAAEYLWEHPASEWSSIAELESVPVVIWRRPGTGETVLAVRRERLETWIADSAQDAGLPIAAVRAEFTGATPPDARYAFRLTPDATGLPWTLALRPQDLTATDWTRGQLLLFSSLGVLLVLVAAGGYAIARLVRSEVAIGRLQSDFVAAVSHEFRTPLASIRHLVDLLDESDAMPTERRTEFYRAIGRNAVRLHRLVESLLDFSRMESGRTPYHRVPVDAEALARTVVSDFTTDLRGRGVEVHVTVAASGHTTVEADAPSLGLALWNLLDNAVKYSPAGTPVEVQVARRDDAVVLSVVDHGHGVPADEQQAVFSRFSRGEAARRLGIPGTGIGLAIVSHVARGHGGNATVTSGHDGGSRFEIVLPIAPSTTPEAPPLAEEAR